MKFLIDSQLPKRLAEAITASGYDALHVDDFPTGSKTSDNAVMKIATKENRILVSRDCAFMENVIFQEMPHRLLFINSNQTNSELINKVLSSLSYFEEAFEVKRVVEIS
ncbi:MAG: DUF5615 family PIN-like protein [Verrucomicrobiota bacterium]